MAKALIINEAILLVESVQLLCSLGTTMASILVKVNDRSFILTAYLVRRLKTGEPL